MLLTDMLEHLQKINWTLQGKDKNIIELSQNIFTFKPNQQVFVHNKTFNNFL